MSVPEKAVRLELRPSPWPKSPSILKSNCSAKSPVRLIRARRRRKRSFIAVFKVHFNESTEHQLNFRSALLDVNGRFLFDDRLFNVRFSVVGDFRFHFCGDLSRRHSLFL